MARSERGELGWRSSPNSGPLSSTTEGAAGGARPAPFFPYLAHAAEVFGSCRKSLGHAHLHVLKIEFVLGERLIEPPERRNLFCGAAALERHFQELCQIGGALQSMQAD